MSTTSNTSSSSSASAAVLASSSATPTPFHHFFSSSSLQQQDMTTSSSSFVVDDVKAFDYIVDSSVSQQNAVVWSDDVYRSLVDVLPPVSTFRGLSQTVDNLSYSAVSTTSSMWSDIDPTSLSSDSSFASGMTTIKKGFEGLAISLGAADSLSSAVDDILLLEECPSWVEHTSFACRASFAPVAVESAVCSALQHLHIDFTCDNNTHKLKGVTFDDSSVSAFFRIQLYRKPSLADAKTQQVLVEVQRRRGCVVAFSQFYRRLLSQLKTVIDGTVAEDSSLGGLDVGPLPLPSLSSSSTSISAVPSSSITLDKETCDLLFCMAQSSDFLGQTEALRILSSASKDVNNAKLILSQSSISSSSASAFVSSSSASAPARKLPTPSTDAASLCASGLKSGDSEVQFYASQLVRNLVSARLPLTNSLVGGVMGVIAQELQEQHQHQTSQSVPQSLTDADFEFPSEDDFSFSSSLLASQTRRTAAAALHRLSIHQPRELKKALKDEQLFDSLRLLCNSSDREIAIPLNRALTGVTSVQ